MQRPLEDIRVLDLSRLLPGPFCSLILTELGADVVKVEDTSTGDYLRDMAPQREGLGGAYYALNRGKRSVAIDLKSPQGRDLFLALLPRFRVVLESFRPGVLERLGLGYEVLRRARDDLILCSVTGYGQHGPLSHRAGHDINFIALAGVLAGGGAPDGPPCLPGVQIADLAGGGLWAAIQILAALRSQSSVHLDVSMTEGAMSLLLPWLGDLAFGGTPPRRGEGALTGGAPVYRPYATADQRYMTVGALEPKFFGRLQEVLQRVAPDAPGPAPSEERMSHAFASATRDEWGEHLAETDACVEPVLEMEELADHPHHQARHMFYSVDDPVRGLIPQLRLPLDLPPGREPAPRLGEHTDEVLEEAGVGPEEIAQLRSARVIR